MRFTRLPILIAVLVLSSALTRAADIRVVSSGGFAAAYRTFAPQFEKTTGNHLITGWGPSMGNTTDAVPQRLASASGVYVSTGSFDASASNASRIANSRGAPRDER